MLLSLRLVLGRFFRLEYMTDLLLLLVVLNVRLACLLVSAAGLRLCLACDWLVGVLAAVLPSIRRADDTSKASSSSARPYERHFSNRGEESEWSASTPYSMTLTPDACTP